jgi:hypothetical protein
VGQSRSRGELPVSGFDRGMSLAASTASCLAQNGEGGGAGEGEGQRGEGWRFRRPAVSD